MLISEPDEVHAHGEKLTEQVIASYEEATSKGNKVPGAAGTRRSRGRSARSWLEGAIALETLSIEDEPGLKHIASQPAQDFGGRISDWVAEIRRTRERGEIVLFVADSHGRAERTVELLAEYEVFAVPVDRAEDSRTASVLVAHGHLSKGFRLPGAGLQIWAEADVFEEERKTTHERRRSAARTFLSDFRDLKVGDLVVHVDHGIGMFVGLKRIEVGPDVQEFMELRYYGEDKLFVPVERLDLVQKYTGGAKPALDKLGGTTWEKAKTRVKKAMRDMAEELLKLYAARKAVPGHAFSRRFALDAGVRRGLRVGTHRRPAERRQRHPRRHGIADADGPPALRRRRLRQDRSRDARRLQGRDGRQAGRGPRADHRPRVPALQDVEEPLRRVPGPHRHGQPLPLQGGTEGRRSRISPPAKSRSSSAPIACCRRTCSTATSGC